MLTRNRMLLDAEYFNLRISKLEGSDDLGPHILELIRAKTVAVDAGAEPQSPVKDVDQKVDG